METEMIERNIIGLAWHDLYACVAIVHPAAVDRPPRRERRRPSQGGADTESCQDVWLPGGNIEPPAAA